MRRRGIVATRPRGAVQAIRPRSDGGVAILLGGSPDEDDDLLELLPDGTIEHYRIGFTLRAMYPSALLPDGSLIVEHNFELVRLTPPT